jgi:hypothetical protein
MTILRWTRLVGARRAAALILTAAPALMPSGVQAADYFGAGLTRESGWADILTTTRIHLELPFVGFGNVFVPISGICADDGNTLRPIDPSLRSRVVLARESPLGPAPLVLVHRMPDSGKDPEGKMVLLFNKPWDTRSCGR